MFSSTYTLTHSRIPTFSHVCVWLLGLRDVGLLPLVCTDGSLQLWKIVVSLQVNLKRHYYDFKGIKC